MAKTHPTAIVEPGAVIHDSAEIGAYSIIGANVVIGARTRVGPHVVIDGNTRIGEDNVFYQFSSIGAPPQDKKYAGEPTRLEMAIEIRFESFVPLIVVRCRMLGLLDSVTITGSWRMCILPMTARSVTTPSLPTTRS